MDGTTTHLYFPHFDEENPGKTHSQTNHNKKSPETHAKLPKATPKTAKRRRRKGNVDGRWQSLKTVAALLCNERTMMVTL